MKENLDSTKLKMEENEYNALDKYAEIGKEFRFADSEPIYGIDIFA